MNNRLKIFKLNYIKVSGDIHICFFSRGKCIFGCDFSSIFKVWQFLLTLRKESSFVISKPFCRYFEPGKGFDESPFFNDCTDTHKYLSDSKTKIPGTLCTCNTNNCNEVNSVSRMLTSNKWIIILWQQFYISLFCKYHWIKLFVKRVQARAINWDGAWQDSG